MLAYKALLLLLLLKRVKSEPTSRIINISTQCINPEGRINLLMKIMPYTQKHKKEDDQQKNTVKFKFILIIYHHTEHLIINGKFFDEKQYHVYKCKCFILINIFL